MARALVVLAGAAIASAASADTVLTFDDLPREQHVGEQYAALGAHFSLTDFGVIGGIGEGDPGNWGLMGTNGTAFMGFNGSPSYEMELEFTQDALSCSFDVSRSNGSEAGDGLHIEYWREGLMVLQRDITFGEINEWTTVSYNGEAGVIEGIIFEGTGANFHPYGVDNVHYAFVPTPGAAAVLGLAGLGALRRRR